tara:strand:+ start:865 stop:1863 length:999 start_codon:yes stop_codon:yes gene_type:complete
MNCFNNNSPNLSASEQIKNRKSKQLYKAAKLAYNAGNNCLNYNGTIGFYPQTGILRNTRSYQTFLELNRGYALCVDGIKDIKNKSGQIIYKGLSSCSRSATGNKVKLVNGRDSIYNIFSGIEHSTDTNEFPVMKSWDMSSNSFVEDGSYNRLFASNKDGHGVVIDPSNILFGADFCSTDINNKTQGPNKYLTFSRVSPFVIAYGHVYKSNGSSSSNISCDSAEPKSGMSVKYGTAKGMIESVCCGLGPNGETNWWEIIIKVQQGQFIPPNTSPMQFTNTSDTYTMKSPTLIEGAGSCVHNLLFGNKTRQNYMISYEPRAKHIRFYEHDSTLY